MKNVECRMACAVGILASSFCLEPAGNAAGTVADCLCLLGWMGCYWGMDGWLFWYGCGAILGWMGCYWGMIRR